MRLLSAGALGSFVLPAQTRKPNIVLILADDLGWGDVGFNGRTTWTTPNLGRLAAQGTRFTRWYSGGVMCGPARACLLTGKYTIHNGVRGNSDDLPAGEVTIAEALQRENYATSLIGKWHGGKQRDGGFTHPLDQGFDETFGFLDALTAHEHFPKQLYRGRELAPVRGYTADIFSDEAIRFVASRRDRPFFLYLAYTEPHFRVEAPDEEVTRFRGRFREQNPAEPVNASYAAMVHRLDKGIGRVMAALDELSLAANTLVVFSSDQGASFEHGNRGASDYHDSNGPLRGQKRSVEEGGIRVPAVVRWPGKVPAGQVSKAVIHMIDVLPTLVAAAGGAVEAAWKVDGVNVLDVFKGQARPPDRTLFWEWQREGGNMYAAMRGDYKLLDIGGQQALYNVETDPGERRNLAARVPKDPQLESFQQLRTALEAWKQTAVKW